jgi:hypothetical protein
MKEAILFIKLDEEGYTEDHLLVYTKNLRKIYYIKSIT